MLFAAETWPFTAATFLMLLIAIVEGVAMVAGATLSGMLQHHLPDPWDNLHGPFDKLLGWLHVGRVPFLVLLVLFLAGFALTGFALNMVAHRFFGAWVPPDRSPSLPPSSRRCRSCAFWARVSRA